MALSERKKKILQVVVDDYIADGQPISSKTIQERHLKDLSTATIRSELAQLEELGYLDHPHTSAGRVPLPKAYRLYAQELMQSTELTEQEIDYVHQKFSKGFPESEYLVRSAAKLISEMTDYTAVGFVEHNEQDTVRNVKLVKLSANTVLLVVVTDVNVIKDSFITTADDVEEEYITAAEQVLVAELVGKRLVDITEESTQILSSHMQQYKMLFDEIVAVLKEYVRSRDEQSVVFEGNNNIFKHEEFQDIETTRHFLEVIDTPGELGEVLRESGDIEISVKIGREDAEALSDSFALVTANYRVNGKSLGSAGVLGPIRMDYRRVFRVLSTISQTLSEMSNPKECEHHGRTESDADDE